MPRIQFDELIRLVEKAREIVSSDLPIEDLEKLIAEFEHSISPAQTQPWEMFTSKEEEERVSPFQTQPWELFVVSALFALRDARRYYKEYGIYGRPELKFHAMRLIDLAAANLRRALEERQ